MTLQRAPGLLVLGILLLAPAGSVHATDAPGPQSPAMPPGFAAPVLDDPALADMQIRSGTADDFLLNLTRFTSHFEAEDYKYNDRSSTRNQDDLENQTTNWETALGHRINATFVIEPFAGESPPLCEERFIPEAYIATTSGRLYGYTPGTTDTSGTICPAGLPGVREFELAFDIDGTSPTVTGSQFPALLPGVYAITFNLYHSTTPSATNPSGTGPLAATVQVPFSIATPQIAPAQSPIRLPESTLRLFTDVGATVAAANEYAMLPQPLRGNDNITATLNFPGVPAGTGFERIDHYAIRTGPDLTPPVGVPDPIAGETPLDELVDQAADTEDQLTVQVEKRQPSLSLDQVPASGAVLMELNATDFAAQSPLTGPTYTPLHVVTIHIPADVDRRITGAASILVPVSNHVFPIRQMQVENPSDGNVPQLGTTLVRLRDSERITGGTTGRNAGDLFALRPLSETTFDLIGKVRLSRDADPSQPWIDGTFPHATFPDDVGEYAVLAILYGANDEFYGITKATRGIGLDVGALRIVEGESGDLRVVVTNLADDGDGTRGEAEFTIDVTLSATGLPSGEPYSVTVQDLVEGGSRVIGVPVEGDAPGQYNVVFTATSGEITTTRDTTVEVISTERAREENRKWYDIPGPDAVLVAMALVGLAALARHRRA